ncbi:MAG TPA: TRAP transporter large permease [Clostridia bacterium]|mgnify:FL=1|nr:TRAP transporter large permease [Clostridia bacterium]
MILIVIFIVLLALGAPIFVAMLAASFAWILQTGNLSLFTMGAQRMYASVNSFTLLAIPLFIFAGLLMNMSGVSKRLFDYANTLVGHITGGLGHVNVVASMFFAGMSGSAVADAAGLGAIEMKAMKDAGFDDGFSGAVTAASSTIGPIIPPSIPMVLFGGLTSVSVGRLFLGGFIPGLVMGFSLMLIVYFVAKKRNYPVSPKATFKEHWRAFLDALPSLIMPVIILGGILSGMFTPTEAATVACLYALALGVFLYKEIDLRKLWILLRETMRNTAQVMAIIAAAGLFGWVMTYQGIPAAIIKSIIGFTDNKYVVLLIINIVLLILGCFMEGNAILILTVPIMVPIAKEFGIDLVHLGVIMCLNTMIGTVTPPVGMCLYPVMTLGNLTMGQLVKEIIPFLIILIVALLLVTYISPLATFLPTLLMG